MNNRRALEAAILVLEERETEANAELDQKLSDIQDHADQIKNSKEALEVTLAEAETVLSEDDESFSALLTQVRNKLRSAITTSDTFSGSASVSLLPVLPVRCNVVVQMDHGEGNPTWSPNRCISKREEKMSVIALHASLEGVGVTKAKGTENFEVQ